MHESEAMNEREALDNDTTAREKCNDPNTTELCARVAELESFAYTVSHDLRAPLQHVIGYVELLEEYLGDALDEEGQRLMQTVVGASREMAALIDHLLTYARNGQGFDMERASELFEVFTRLNRGDQYGGHGIGLANVRRIVERHGGSVRAASHPGAGACFTVTLPSPEGRDCGAHDAASN